MKLAIVHDWIKNLTGAERVLIELHKMYPKAPIYTLFYDRKFVREYLPDADIRATFLQGLPGWLFKFLMPTAIESLDLSEYDVVLSSSVIFSKGLVLKPGTKHVCYCYSPTRQVWDDNRKSLASHFLRIWDRSAADRVDQFVAISQTVADRIKKYYRRDSIVIYPPVPSLPAATPSKSDRDYYLIVSRLYNSKNIQIAIEAFNKLGYELVIIGDGPEQSDLKRKASGNIKFLGHQSDEVIAQYYSNCRAFIMPQEEDFGLTAVEAMSFGKPVLALRKGGATETVIEGVAGEFFDDPIPEGLADGLRRLNENYAKYNADTIKLQAQKFSVERFRAEINKILTK